MKVRYIGSDIGADGLFSGKVYTVLSVDDISGYLAIIDESGEDYLYNPKHPQPIANPKHPGGRFEIVEDDAFGTLQKAIYD